MNDAVSIPSKSSMISLRSIVVFCLVAFFYLYEFALQVSPGVITDALMESFRMDAAGLGILSAFYFYAYTPMQIPAGILFDRYGPRLLITSATFGCAAGALFFSYAQNVQFAAMGRWFMGFGSSFAFIGVLVVIARWFPARYFAVMAGLAQAMSSLGAIAGEIPLAKAVENFGWRNTLFFMGIMGFILSLAVWLVVRDFPFGESAKKDTVHNDADAWRKFKDILVNPQTWYAGLYNFMVWGPIAAFAGLWGIPYIKSLYQINDTLASSVIAMIWVGVAVGSPLTGWISDWIGQRKWPLSIVAILGFVITLIFLHVPNIPLFWMYFLMFLFGLAASGQVLTFALVKDINLPSHVGTAAGFNNMATVAGGAIFQPLIGYLLIYFWDGRFAENVPVYSATTYESALLLLPFCYLCAALISVCLLKETHCQSRH